LPLVLAVSSLMATTSCVKVVKAAKLKNSMDSASYAIGVINGNGFKNSLRGVPGDTLNVDDLIDGFVTALKGKETKISYEEADSVIRSYFDQVHQNIVKTNQAEGEKFLNENKVKEGVVATESGLQYKIVKEGDGAQPAEEDMVKVNYRGTLLSGDEFDKGDSVNLNLKSLIKGWKEGLQLMKVGSRYELYIPDSLAYGDREMRKIKPGSTLIFEVELLDVIKPETSTKKK